MLRMLKQRINDIRTIKSICLQAERHANADGQKAPGLEHFVLAALDLPDGTARQAFLLIGADPGDFRSAIAEQYDNALKSIGFDTSHPESIQCAAAGTSPDKGIYRSQPQVQPFMRRLAERKKTDAGEALLGAHVIETIAAFQHGVAARTFAMMGIDRQALMESARNAASGMRAGVHAG